MSRGDEQGSIRVVIAPDSFKGTASASDAAAALAAGWMDIRPADEVVVAAMADGGEGTLDAIAAAVPGTLRTALVVRGPDDRPVAAEFLVLPNGTAVVELASTSGITLLDRPRPLTAHTRGFGVAIRAALDGGATTLLLAIGGSGSTDGGAGMLQELGARFLDETGAVLTDGIARVAGAELADLRPLPPGGVRVLTDVVNPLLGPAGAAAVYGPQKGASPREVTTLEAGLARLATALPADPLTPGAGAAGGTGFGLLAWGAVLVPGAPEVAVTLGLHALIANADLVITGEGRFDSQSAAGKAVEHVRTLAEDAGVPVALVAGAIEVPPAGFESAVSLTELVGRAAAMAEPLAAIRSAGAALASRW